MTKLAVDLTDELRAFVESSVESGRFHNASEVVASALHTLKNDEGAKFEALRADLAIGLDQAERGEFADFNAETIIAEGRSRLLASAKP